MNKLIFCIQFCLLTIISFAQSESMKGPRITFLVETIDYGSIEYGSNGYRNFELYNTGDAPLIINSCKGSCSCTIAECPKEAILPGKGTTIRVLYDTNRIGQFTKQISVESNDPVGIKVIRIIGNVIPSSSETPH